MNDEFTDQVRFFLPMCVGECYGELPATMLDASSPKFFSRIKITLYIQMKGAIRSVVSSTHPTLAALPYQEPGKDPSQHRMVARFESLEYLEQDFVVSIQAQGLDEPRCFAERNDKRKTTAMQLALVPKFDLPPIPSQEYIFLIDRSGSMKGNRIEMARRTLMMLLRALPVKGTTFNIFSFGSHSSKMSPESMVYSQATLHSAVHLIIPYPVQPFDPSSDRTRGFHESRLWRY